MIGKAAPIPSKTKSIAPSRRRQRQRGQSLVEFALSLSFLVIAFSGSIDLGRAFFTRITLDSAVSEGAHWTAAYPGCVAYGATFGDLSNVVNAPPACKGTNSIFQRIRNESSLLLAGNISSITLLPPTGTTIDKIQPGQTITISVVYTMPLITPVMNSIFGNSLTLQVDAREVVRGTLLPPTKGKVSTYSPVSTVPMVPISSLAQADATSNSACNNGYPPLTFKEPATAQTGYVLYTADAGTGATTGTVQTYTSIGANQSRYGPFAAPEPRIDPTTGGNTLYAVQAYQTNASPPPANLYSDFSYILASCTLAQPTLKSFTCQNQTGSPPQYASVTFTWSMPRSYAWSPDQPVDKAITRYHLYKVVGGVKTELTPPQYFNVASLTVGSDQWTFTSPSFNFVPGTSPVDPNRSAYYRLAANDGTSDFGLESDSSNDMQIDCP